MSAGILQAISDPTAAVELGRRAHELAERKYSYEAYLGKTRIAMAKMAAEPTPATAGGAR
jgi:hypothetical protein